MFKLVGTRRTRHIGQHGRRWEKKPGWPKFTPIVGLRARIFRRKVRNCKNQGARHFVVANFRRHNFATILVRKFYARAFFTRRLQNQAVSRRVFFLRRIKFPSYRTPRHFRIMTQIGQNSRGIAAVKLFRFLRKIPGAILRLNRVREVSRNIFERVVVRRGRISLPYV